MREELVKQLKNEGIWAKKSLGQNFLVDGETLNKIVEAADLEEGEKILEIGPGMGVLTEKLLMAGVEVLAVEKDERLAEKLEKKFAVKKLRVLPMDILEFEPEKFDLDEYKIVANIPYYITGKILEKFLGCKNKPSRMILLVQDEAADRICTEKNNLSLLSISVLFYGKPEKIAKVPKESFFPMPKVNSAILRVFDISNKYPEIDEKMFFRLVKIGFSSRRKTLLNNLKAGFDIPADRLSDIIEKIGFSNLSRAQELKICDWLALYEEIY